MKEGVLLKDKSAYRQAFNVYLDRADLKSRRNQVPIIEQQII